MNNNKIYLMCQQVKLNTIKKHSSLAIEKVCS